MQEQHAFYPQFACYEQLITTDMNAVNTVTLKIHVLSSEQVEPYNLDLCTYVQTYMMSASHCTSHVTTASTYTHLLAAQ